MSDERLKRQEHRERCEREPKPLLDAINDAVSALTDVIRSLRAQSTTRNKLHGREGVAGTGTKPVPKSPAKPRPRRTRTVVVQATVAKDEQSVTADVEGRHHGLRAKIVHAWDLLTRDPTEGARANGHGRRI